MSSDLEHIAKFCNTSIGNHLYGISYQSKIIFSYYAYIAQLPKYENADTERIATTILSIFDTYASRYLRYIAQHSPVVDKQYIISDAKNNLYGIPMSIFRKQLYRLANDINAMSKVYNRGGIVDGMKYSVVIGDLHDKLIYSSEKKQEQYTSLQFNPTSVRFYILHLIYNLLNYKPIFIIGNDKDIKEVDEFNKTDSMKYVIIFNETLPDTKLSNYIKECKIGQVVSLQLFTYSDILHGKKIKTLRFDKSTKSSLLPSPETKNLPKYKTIPYPEYLIDDLDEPHIDTTGYGVASLSPYNIYPHITGLSPIPTMEDPDIQRKNEDID